MSFFGRFLKALGTRRHYVVYQQDKEESYSREVNSITLDNPASGFSQTGVQYGEAVISV